MTRRLCSESLERDADHSEADEGSDGHRITFVVARQAAIATGCARRNRWNAP